MGTMELEQLLELFKFLSSPFDDSIGKSTNGCVINSPTAVFENITEFCLKHVEFLESSKSLLNNIDDSLPTTPTTSWKLTCLILSMLSRLKETIEEVESQQSEEEKCIDILSIQSQIYVQKSVELVIGFGIVPYLLPGLGVPQKLRKMSSCVSHFLVDAQAASPYEQYLRLSHTLEILLSCCKHVTLNSLIAQKYTSDILAGLLQICKSPIVRPKVSQSHYKPGALSLDEYNHVMKIRENLSVLMTEIFVANVPKQILINSLFLVGAAEKPRWIGTSCNDMLCNIMLSKNGLLVVSYTMVDVSGSCDTWKLMRVLSSLMRNCLVKVGNSLDHSILCNLAKQCVLLVVQNHEPEMDSKDQTGVSNDISNKGSSYVTSSLKLPYGTNVDLVHIGLFCGLTLMDIDFQLVKSTFWDRLFYHVLLLDACLNFDQSKLGLESTSSKVKELKLPSSKISSSVQNLGISIMHAELLLALLKPMNVFVPLKLLQPLWSLLLQIFVACDRYLKKPVQEPNVAAAAEQLHHKLKNVLILLFEIYGSGAGESFVLPSAGNGDTAATSSQASPSFSTTSSKINAKAATEAPNLCDFIMMLLLNKESHGVPTLNTFDLVDDDSLSEVHLVLTHQEIISESSDYNEVYEKYLDGVCICLSNEILKNERLKEMWATLFYQLLAWGTKRHVGEKAAIKHKMFKSDEFPTRLEGNAVKVSLTECQKFITFKLLGELSDEEKILEQFGNSESMDETLSFLELLLNKFVDEVSSDMDNAFDASQLITYALGIIGALIDAASTSVAALSSQCGSSSQSPWSSEINTELDKLWDNLEMFIPHLRKLSECTQTHLTRQGVPEMASSLLLSIGTRGLDHKPKKFPLHKTGFQQALEDASSPMIHVKGHGLLELRRLIERRNDEALENETQVLKIFQEHLSNDDSYIYLMSIQGMATLALKFHKSVIPILIKEYDFISCGDGGNDNENPKNSSCRRVYDRLNNDERIETRMKVGEILVKVVQKLGELAPSYRAPLTNVFFRMMRDEEPLIRASALSNLGELCHLLKFSLGIVLTEVWFCVESVLSTEKNIHVRRAALHLLVLLLKGVQNDFRVEDILNDMQVSQHLRDVRRLLTRIEQSEVDLVAKTHCQLALQELELIVKKLLTPTTSLSYKIEILEV